MSGKRNRYDWGAVQAWYDAGNDRKACIARFGFTAVAWYKAIQRGRLQATVSKTRYDWAAVQSYYDEGHSVLQCMQQFGFFTQAWAKAKARGLLRPRPRKSPLAQILVSGRRCSVKRRLIEAGILKNVCEECGLDSWRGKPLSIQLDHRNGVPDDHRLENLRMLCPNCHSQTETFAGRKSRGTKRYSRVVQW